MSAHNRKYSWAVLASLLFFLQGFLWGGCGRMNFPGASRSKAPSASAESIAGGNGGVIDPAASVYEGLPEGVAEAAAELVGEGDMVILADTLIDASETLPDSLAFRRDSLLQRSDSLQIPLDSLLTAADSAGFPTDTTPVRQGYGKPFLDDVISGHNQDSVVYDVKAGLIHIYKEGEIVYGDKTIKADYMVMGADSKLVDAYGILDDSTGLPTRPIFVDGAQEFTMDSLRYNLGSEKAIIKGVWTKEGDGILRGTMVKKMPDNTLNIARGVYSTCDAEHPHFYLEMSKAKVLPGKKAVFGYTYMVMEDVPLPFVMLPFGFFPLASDRTSGFIMPTVGEEGRRGFFLKNGGYYYAPNDYMDLTLLAGVYSKGSWETSLSSRYHVRYKFSGTVNLQYDNFVIGEKGSSDYSKTNNFAVRWSHSQDPKFKPGSTFSASVDFKTAGASRTTPTNINDYVNSSSNSSISYSKNWAGTPFSFSTNMSYGVNNRDSMVTLGLPNFNFSVSRIFPFRRQNRIGKEQWYEKISMQYTTNFTNNVQVKQDQLFTDEMYDKMQTAMTHSIPISATFNLFNYINLSPSFNYNENWNFEKTTRKWDPELEQVVNADTTRGLYRVYRYNASMSASTTVYGTFNFKPTSKVQAIRHVVTPQVSFSVSPDFGDPKYGFFEPVQKNREGDIEYYSPYRAGASRGSSASMSFSLGQTLEAKVLSDDDSTGVRKIKIIDQLSFSGSYNFLADSMKLSPTIPVTFRSTLIKGFDVNFTANFGLYEVDPVTARPYDRLLWKNGKLPRLESIGTSFNWNFKLGKGAPGAMNTGTIGSQAAYDPLDPLNQLNPLDTDPALLEQQQMEQQQQMMAYRHLLSSQYYDFSVPFNLGINYSINYTNNGVKKSITQTAGFNTSVNLTPKWGITFNANYDFVAKKLVTGAVNLTRDLHCWQMNFNWIPFGTLKSWSFTISVKSNILRDLKYDKSSSHYDNIYYDNF